MKKLSFFLMAMLFSVMSFAAESLLVTLDFSTNTWELPVGSANKTTATENYTNGGYTITLAGGGSGHYYNNDGYLIFGKSGATLTLPAFDFKTTKIVVTGRNGASTSVLQNIYVGATAVSTQTKGAAGTNTYAIAEDYQAAGNVYVLKVTSSHNTQIVKMEIYGEEGGEEPETPVEPEEPEEPEEPVVPEGPENLGAKTIAEFLELKNTTDTCVLTGVVANIVNTTYGNFDLVDATGTVYVYGLLTAAGESKQFASMDIAAGDTLTVKAIYNEYNSKAQAKNAIYVSHTKAAAPVVPENLGAKTIAEFLALKNTTDTCVLTGVVANIANTEYGNFDLVDATGSVYVYGLLTAAGESKQFASMDIAAGDTLTVKAIYNEYNSKPQAKNAIYVSHSKLVLTVKVTSENGTVYGLADGGKYVRGAEATLTATPAEGYEFVNWTVGEEVVSTENPYSFVVDADVALVANFEEAEPALKGVVKRAVQLGESVVVLTHEADGTAHIYNVVGENISEVSLEGVVPVDPEDEFDYLAISDIAVTEDGKLVATNYTRCNFGSTTYGTSYFYLWNDLDADPTIWFQSNASSNSTYSDQGYTMAVKGTSTNAVVMTTGVHNTKRGVRMSQYTIIDGVYEDINNAGGIKTSEYYFLFGQTDNVVFNENNSGTNLELNALGENWVMDGNLIEPTEWAVPATMSENHIVKGVIAEGTLGKKYNGATYVTVGNQVLMVAPYADAEGKLAGVKILDVTAGFAAATEVATADLDAAVEATAAATAVAVAENVLTITLVADATIYTLNVELESEPNYMVIEDNITNLVIDFENMAIIGGPSTMWQVEVYLGLGQDNGDGTITLTEESSVAIMGFDARFIDGYVYDIDANAPAVKAVLHVEDSGFFYEIKLDMTSAAPADPIVVVVEDATVQIDTIPLFGDQVDYALKMTADWTYAEDGVTYPVLVEVPVYYPEATEPSEMTCTVTIGGMGDTDPWLGFGEGPLTITTVDGVVTAKGIVANPYTGVAFDVTVSGKLPQDPGPGTGIEDVELEVKAVKVIKNGQLIINRDGKSYNAQGAIVK